MVAHCQLTFSPSGAALLLTLGLTPPAVPEPVGGAAAWLERRGGGFNHTDIQVLTILRPIWVRGEVSQGVGPAATHSLSP